MIKNIFNPGNYPKNIDYVLLLLRLGVGIFMLTHGMGKYSKLFAEGPIKFADPIGVGVTASLALAFFAEVFCSILLILGLGTRLAAVPLLITMLVAALIVHANDGFGKQELPLMYSTIYLAIAIAGAGKISIDNWIYNKMNS
ncbi:MAG: DoxX family protein [Saprospiraceae bacterium]|jgi:putative oxidoreductase|nr:DoxX family protein [Saprospiraceae bacterium]MBL0026856.1 DoxX family protein [Saprospiraceae bacterium]